MTSSFKLCTSGQQRCQPETARQAWYCQVHHSKKRLEQIAGEIGISPSALSDAVNPDGDGSMLAARHHETVLRLTSDNLALVGYYARAQHAVVYALPSVDQADAQTAKVVREFGEFLTKHADAHADHRVTTREAIEIELEGQQAITAIVAAIEDAKREAREADAGRPS
jgi:hypothetical protein